MLAKYSGTCAACEMPHIVAEESEIEPYGNGWAVGQCIVRQAIAFQVIEGVTRDLKLTKEQLRRMDRMEFLRTAESRGAFKQEHLQEVKNLLVWYWKGILTKKMGG